MLFEEFFKKKRIDLAALEKAQPALFSEFKTHYEQMGEKSFDHTKKYWFNKIRRQYQLAPEVKTEKVQIANQLAEQTITESLTETTVPSPTAKLGFAPKFKAGNMPKSAANTDKKEEPENTSSTESIPVGNPVEGPAPTPAYVPRFKMKPKTEVEDSIPAIENTPPAENIPIENADESAAPKAGYVPRFKMKPKAETEETTPTTESTPPSPENTEEKPAYKPRFNMKNISPKQTE
ncbi:MAG: hypothetical protein JWP45_3081 [Mucilaginibacter sp.]|jgi:hypothetical protein|nr:hypothetical protein [Mucilaginibacter sp.]